MKNVTRMLKLDGFGGFPKNHVWASELKIYQFLRPFKKNSKTFQSMAKMVHGGDNGSRGSFGLPDIFGNNTRFSRYFEQPNFNQKYH